MAQGTLRVSSRQVLCALLAAALLAPLAGCSRSKARLRADRDANCLIDQKTAVLGDVPGRYRIGVNPQSRMFDENDPDFPPMPPDDPISHRYLECVDGKKGAKYWREAPRTPYVENPNWRAMLPLDQRGRLVLDTEAAVRLGLVNDPDYQRELEELYLSALDVSFERFRFDVQPFYGAAVDFTQAGRVATGSGESSSQLFVSPSSSRSGPATPNRLRFQRLTATGGQMVAGLANTLVWQFSGTNTYSSATLLDFSIVQPLLRGGGRVLVLERLTVAERTLLANVRSMERFRREYYLNVVTGRGTGGGPQRRGGLLGAAGLTNFTGVNFGVGGGGGGGFGGGGGAGAAGAAAAGGYLGLLQTQQVVRNQRANVAALRDSTLQLEASYDAGRIDRFQVDLARQALFNAQSQLLRAEADYETTLDNYKIDLGLPPDLELLVRDDLLDQFNLLSPQLTSLQDEAAEVLERARGEELGDNLPTPRKIHLATQVYGPEPLEIDLEEIRQTAAESDDIAPQLASAATAEPVLAEPTEAPTLVAPLANEAQRLIEAARGQLILVESDVERLLAVAPTRREHLQEIGTRPELVEAKIDPAIFDPARFDMRVEQLQGDLVGWDERLDQLAARADSASDDAELREIVSLLSGQLLELTILQARARLDAIDLRPTDLTSLDALRIASTHRRDWANARAGLVDAWRLIHFNANDLKSAVDLVFSGDIGNVSDKPFDLRGSNGNLRVGVQFDSPLSRLAERNVYRQSLIEYQQARRSYYRFVDRVHQGLRSTLRQVRLNEINLELRREAVFVAIAQVDLTQLRLSEPPKPGAEEQLNSNTARDLVQALGDLLSVQNDLLSVWVNNRVQRFNLELDLGVMMVDPWGQRVEIDNPLEAFLYDQCCPGGGDVKPMGPDLTFPPDLVSAVGQASAVKSEESVRLASHLSTGQGREIAPITSANGLSKPVRLPAVE